MPSVCTQIVSPGAVMHTFTQAGVGVLRSTENSPRSSKDGTRVDSDCILSRIPSNVWVAVLIIPRFWKSLAFPLLLAPVTDFLLFLRSGPLPRGLCPWSLGAQKSKFSTEQAVDTFSISEKEVTISGFPNRV